MAVPKRNADDDEEPADDHNEVPAAEPEGRAQAPPAQGGAQGRRLAKAAATSRFVSAPCSALQQERRAAAAGGDVPRPPRREAHLQPQGHEDLAEVLAPLEQLPQLAQHLKAEVVQVQGGYARVRIQARS